MEPLYGYLRRSISSRFFQQIVDFSKIVLARSVAGIFTLEVTQVII